jgi:hypothetical protein
MKAFAHMILNRDKEVQKELTRFCETAGIDFEEYK